VYIPGCTYQGVPCWVSLLRTMLGIPPTHHAGYVPRAVMLDMYHGLSCWVGVPHGHAG